MEGMMIKNPRIESISDAPITWKLYENPFYTQQPSQIHQNISHKKQIHSLHFPISARKIADSFWDLSFIKPLMESELVSAREKFKELKTEVERERKARKKAESINKKLARELSEERKGKEALDKLFQELAKEISSEKEQINRMKMEIVEERKMLRVAEVLREERVQMKLSEAKLLLEERLSELEDFEQIQQNLTRKQTSELEGVRKANIKNTQIQQNLTRNNIATLAIQRPEPENHHIKRGIKGFVEFPKVVRAIGSKSKHLGTKLECQKAQLRLLLKQKTSLIIRSNSVITT